MNKHKMHRHGVKKGYYAQQFNRTLANKSRRAKRRARRAALHA